MIMEHNCGSPRRGGSLKVVNCGRMGGRDRVFSCPGSIIEDKTLTGDFEFFLDFSAIFLWKKCF